MADGLADCREVIQSYLKDRLEFWDFYHRFMDLWDGILSEDELRARLARAVLDPRFAT